MYQYLFGWLDKSGFHYHTYKGDSKEEAINNFKNENGDVIYRIITSDEPEIQ
jgi:hypothetical protein